MGVDGANHEVVFVNVDGDEAADKIAMLNTLDPLERLRLVQHTLGGIGKATYELCSASARVAVIAPLRLVVRSVRHVPKA